MENNSDNYTDTPVNKFKASEPVIHVYKFNRDKYSKSWMVFYLILLVLIILILFFLYKKVLG